MNSLAAVYDWTENFYVYAAVANLNGILWIAVAVCTLAFACRRRCETFHRDGEEDFDPRLPSSSRPPAVLVAFAQMSSPVPQTRQNKDVDEDLKTTQHVTDGSIRNDKVETITPDVSKQITTTAETNAEDMV
jgi:hypothetical protein